MELYHCKTGRKLVVGGRLVENWFFGSEMKMIRNATSFFFKEKRAAWNFLAAIFEKDNGV